MPYRFINYQYNSIQFIQFTELQPSQKAIAAVADEIFIFFKNGNFILEYGPRKFFGFKTFHKLGKKQCKEIIERKVQLTLTNFDVSVWLSMFINK